MTIAMSIVAHNLSVAPIIAAVIIIGAAAYFIMRHRSNSPNGHDK